MAQLIQQELQRWGFNLRMKNEFEKFKLFRVNNFVKDGRGVLQVQEMLSLRIQLVRGVVVDEDGNKTDPAEFALATGVEGNGEVKDDELPIEVKPKLSYVHGVSIK